MKKILLIEDNKDHAELIQRSLVTGLGKVKVLCATRMKEAFELLNRQKFDLILSDYYLPDSKGENHVRKLAQKAPDIPIIIITGQGDEKTAARSIKAGADDYIVKTREALKALPKILNRAIAKHESHQSKKQIAIRKHMDKQKKSIQQVLVKMEDIEKKMRRLEKRHRANKKMGHVSDTSPFDFLAEQINGVKDYISKLFSAGK